jgi:hypothetical protein
MAQHCRLHPLQVDGIVDAAHFVNVIRNDIDVVFVGLCGLRGHGTVLDENAGTFPAMMIGDFASF